MSEHEPFSPAAAERARMSEPELRDAVNAIIRRERIVLPADPDESKELLAELVLRVLYEKYREELQLEKDVR